MQNALKYRRARPTTHATRVLRKRRVLLAVCDDMSPPLEMSVRGGGGVSGHLRQGMEAGNVMYCIVLYCDDMTSHLAFAPAQAGVVSHNHALLLRARCWTLPHSACVV